MPKLEIIEYHPESPISNTPLVFLHGAWHGAWCWKPNFLPWFRDRGYHCIAFSLRNHGKSESKKKLNLVRIKEYVEDLASVVEGLDTKPIIIAHSMGGLVTQKYLESHTPKAVAFLTPIPPQGTLGAVGRTFLRQPLNFLYSAGRMSLYHLLNTPKKARRLLFSEDLPEADLLKYMPDLQSESFLAFVVDFSFPRIKKGSQPRIPMIILTGDNDKIFTPKEQAKTARFYNAPLEVFLGIAHNMMLETQWEKVAERVFEWLREVDK